MRRASRGWWRTCFPRSNPLSRGTSRTCDQQKRRNRLLRPRMNDSLKTDTRIEEVAMPRLFTALEIPRDAALSLSLLRGGLPGARWVDVENYHLTLRF